MAAKLSADFLGFLSDPGINLSHPKKDPLLLEDFFVFPQLVISFASPGDSSGIFSSKELTEVDTLPAVVLITGPEDSGKTSLLKSLIRHYSENGLYPLYLDGKATGPVLDTALWELIRSSYESQYIEGHLTPALTSVPGKRICLFDNFDRAGLEKAVVTKLLEEFGHLLLTSGTPFLGSLKLNGNGPLLDARISEFGPDLREELCRKWHGLGAHSPGSEEVIKASTEMMEEALERGFSPSYPVLLLTILHTSGSGEDYGPSGDAYTIHFEHIITKPLKEIKDAGRSEDLARNLSEVAYKMYAEGRSALSPAELREVFKENDISELIQAGVILDTAAGLRFKYDYSYYYFAASHLAQNLSSEAVREDVKNLLLNLGDSGSANIMLFLTHLSDDAFITEQVTRALETSRSETAEQSLDESAQELEELINSIVSASDKDRKLRELREEYVTGRDRLWTPDMRKRAVSEYKPPSDWELLAGHLGSVRSDFGLLAVAGELIKKRLFLEPAAADTTGLTRTYYRFWLRSLEYSIKSLASAQDTSPADRGTYEAKEPHTPDGESYVSDIERFSLALSIFTVYSLMLSDALGQSSLSQVLTDENDRIPALTFSLFDLASRPARGDYAPAASEVERLLSETKTLRFARELIRRTALARLQRFYSGSELDEKISALEAVLRE